MNGRVKTLNPLIYGGLLNRPLLDDDIQNELGIKNIDLIIVNLYPFEKTIAKDNVNEEERETWMDDNPFTPNIDPRPANAFKNLFSDIEKLKLTLKCLYILLKIEKRNMK